MGRHHRTGRQKGVSLNYYQHSGVGGVSVSGGGISLVRIMFGLIIGGSVIYVYVGYLINTFACFELAPNGPCLPSSLIGNISMPDYDVIVSSMSMTRVVEVDNGRRETQFSRGTSCGAVAPCYYPDEVALRIIVIVMNRFRSLSKLLESLDQLQMDGDAAALEIWIDRDKMGRVSQKAYDVASGFVWRHGVTRVYVHRTHVGLYGQWIHTWRLRSNDSRELALILEDDISVSPYAWRWVKAVHQAFGERRDIAGYTLQCENVNRADGKGPVPLLTNDTVFLYRIVGSWGFVPHPHRWAEFQDWYERVREQRFFKPYVDGIYQTDWYRRFEREGRQDTMWTMWFIRYSIDHDLSVVYSNLSSIVAGSVSNSQRGKPGSSHGPGYFLAVHRQEPGLHFFGKPRDGSYKLLKTWSSSYVNFTSDTQLTKYDFNGSPSEPSSSNPQRPKDKIHGRRSRREIRLMERL